jgi:hypothetical protein
MKNAPLVRHHIVSYLVRLRTYVSMLPDNLDATDRLRGPSGEERCARIVGFILKELGHESESPVEAPASQVRRAVNRVRGAE